LHQRPQSAIGNWQSAIQKTHNFKLPQATKVTRNRHISVIKLSMCPQIAMSEQTTRYGGMKLPFVFSIQVMSEPVVP
jgi:hypothetical protein